MHAGVKVKEGFNRAMQESQSECRQGSEYQTVKYREYPKPESARTQTRVETGKSELHLTYNRPKLTYIRVV